MTDHDTAHAIAALSARVMALEGAIHALMRGGTFDQERMLAVFDAFAGETLDTCLAKPIDDAVLGLIRQSFDDLRALLLDDRVPGMAERNEPRSDDRGSRAG